MKNKLKNKTPLEKLIDGFNKGKYFNGAILGEKIVKEEYKSGSEVEITLHFNRNNLEVKASFIFPNIRKKRNLSQYIQRKIDYDIVPDLIFDMITLNNSDHDNLTVDDLIEKDFDELMDLAVVIGFPYNSIKDRSIL